jgi:hypothetical protein
MISTRRTWREPRTLNDLETLAELLCTRQWPLCTAFRVGNLTLLNESGKHQVAAEYAVLRDDQLIDSIVVTSTLDPRRLASHLRCLSWLRPLRWAAEDPARSARLPLLRPLYHSPAEPCCLCAVGVAPPLGLGGVTADPRSHERAA